MEREGPAKVKTHHDDAFRYINEGLKFDEQGNKQKALQFYQKGLRSIAVGLSVYCSDSGSGCEQTKELQKKMKSAKEQVKERIQALSASLNPNPSAPSENVVDGQSQNGHLASDEELEACYLSDQEANSWEDVKELLVLERSVKMFFVSGQGSVTTLSQPQTLYAYQFVNYEPESHEAPAFLQCGAWMFPMVPGRSPVLNTEPHTYMFPDITIDPSSPPPSKPRPQKAFASVGLILNPNISSMELNRFERILKCYTDFHHYTPPKYSEEEVQDVDQSTDEVTTPSVPSAESTDEHGSSIAAAVRPSTDVVPADSSQRKSWGRKVSKGITIGSELIAWGLTKGAEVGSHLMQKGSAKLRENLKPNEKPVEVEEKVQDNIRQVKTVAGMTCQVSGAVVAAVSAMTAELGRRLAPVIVEKGGKVLPDSLKKDDVDGTSTMDEFVKVAVSGARGAATIYQGLENSWKVLYKSLQHATVQTVDHKYGPAVAEATNNSMGAAGLVLQTYWNVENIGIKALAKRTAKDAGKEVVNEAEKKYITNGKQ